MNRIEIFLENTKDALPHINVRRFCKTQENPGIAIDLGCGSGRDTTFLIKNGWKVISIDREDTQAIIESHLSEKEKKNFTFIQTNFEDISLNKNNLVVANFSIPFCKKEYVKELWNKIVDSIEVNRIFYRKFFWI